MACDSAPNRSLTDPSGDLTPGCVLLRPHCSIHLDSLLQKQALALYRQALRVARAKPADGGGREGVEALARAQFEQYRSVPRKDFVRIEHLLRRGQRQVEMLQKSDVTGVLVKGSAGAATMRRDTT